MLYTRNERVLNISGWKKHLRLIGPGWLVIGLTFPLACFLGWLFLGYSPMHVRVQTLSEQKSHWQTVLAGPQPAEPLIPAIDQLPDILEICRKSFLAENVQVTSMNVERFADKKESHPADLDYALVRLRFNGTWPGMVKGLQDIESQKNLAVHVKEISLKPEGGESLLQIYFRLEAGKHLPGS